MTTNLFQGSGPSTSGGDTADINIGGTFMNTDDGGNGGHKYIGVVSRRPNKARLFPSSFDPMAAKKKADEVSFHTWSNKMLSPMTLASCRDKVLERNHITTLEDAVVEGFVRAMCLSHAKNSGSTIQPARAGFTLTYRNTTYVFNFFTDVMDILMDDGRRFFREYADYTRDVLLDVLSHRGEPEYAEDIRDIDWVARERGLERYPHLIHDSAEACSGLTRAEGLALASSKQSVLAQYRGRNPVDHPLLLRSEGGQGGGGRMHESETGAQDAPSYA